MLAMLLNHISTIFLSSNTYFGEFCLDIGYFTAPIMCWFLVEGYHHTRSKLRYGLRLLLFALISELPFRFAFGSNTRNMIFTLFFCFLLLVAEEWVDEPISKLIIQSVLIFSTINCDWPVIAGLYTILFAHAYGSRKKTIRAFGIATGLFVFIQYLNYRPVSSGIITLVHALCSGLGVLLAGIVIIFLYNGKRSRIGRQFYQWFFYCFYPIHLVVLGLIHIL